jgi:hypothetical protein
LVNNFAIDTTNDFCISPSMLHGYSVNYIKMIKLHTVAILKSKHTTVNMDGTYTVINGTTGLYDQISNILHVSSSKKKLNTNQD